MGGKRNRCRSARIRNRRGRDEAACPANDWRGVEQGRVSSDDSFPLRECEVIQNRYQAVAVCGFLLLAVVLVFGQTLRHEFVNYDDGDYVSENPLVSHGVTAQGIIRAFTRSQAANWVPLTWISLMVDCQFYGLNAGGYHLTNVLLHTAAVILLFLVLWRMTGGLWPSALVAALFAIHPLRVESVAWVTERKDVLSGLFFMLTLGAYVGYVRHRFSLVRYLAVIAVFAAGADVQAHAGNDAAGTVVVGLLAVASHGPCGRGGHSGCRRQMSAATKSFRPSCPGEGPPIGDGGPCLRCHGLGPGQGLDVHRVLSLVVADRQRLHLVRGLCRPVLLSGGFGGAVSASGPGIASGEDCGGLFRSAGRHGGAWVGRRRCPYVLVGWLWYLGMLLPVIGLVQVGATTSADRFTYLPQIGLCLALVWAAADSGRTWLSHRWMNRMGDVAAALLLAISMASAWRQTSFSRDSGTLWVHTRACTAEDSRVYVKLALARERLGRPNKAIADYHKALQINPGDALALNNLGNCAAARGRLDEAATYYQKALESKPDFVDARNNLGVTLGRKGKFGEAIAQFQRVLQLDPTLAAAHRNLGLAFQGKGKTAEAIAEFRRALELKPDFVAVHYLLGVVLQRKEKPRRRWLTIGRSWKWSPTTPRLITIWRGCWRPIPSCRCETSPRRSNMPNGLTSSVAAGGRRCSTRWPPPMRMRGVFPKPWRRGAKALNLASQQNNHDLTDAVRGRITLYEAGKPYRQTPAASKLGQPKP